MKEKLRASYHRQMFFPAWLGVFINLFYLVHAGLRDAMVGVAPVLSGRLLDVGRGSKPCRSLFSVDFYIRSDIDSDISRQRNIADHFYDGNVFPFADGSFDSVLCNQVLTSGGQLLLSVPFVWGEHAQPV